MKILLASVIALSSVTPVLADDYQRGYSSSRTCLKTEYREEYVPGTRENPGYIKTYNETVEVPCKPLRLKSLNNSNKVTELTDNNDCSEGSLIGGILGAGLATSSSRGKDRW